MYWCWLLLLLVVVVVAVVVVVGSAVVVVVIVVAGNDLVLSSVFGTPDETIEFFLGIYTLFCWKIWPKPNHHR